MSNAKIRPADLRIGNWYHSVKFNCPVVCEASDIVQIYHNADGAEVDEDHIAMVFKPIILTGHWFVQFDFAMWYNGLIAVKSGVELAKEQGIYRYAHGKDRWKDVDFVHQLQNLYYPLTGTELSLSNPTPKEIK